MSDVLVLATARARGIALPADDDEAQEILDEVEAWLARFLGGPLTGSRTETFYVGLSHWGKLSLSRYTDAVTIEDNGVAVSADDFRLIDRGSAVARDYHAPSWWWNGPYVEVTYTPNDELEVASVGYQMVGLEVNAAVAAGGMQMEVIGSYTYQRAPGAAKPVSTTASRKALASSLVPERDSLYTLNITAERYDHPVTRRSGVINIAEPPL